MMNRLQDAYYNTRWGRFGAGMGLCICFLLLYALDGGFPPWAWRLLWEIRLTLPALIAARGAAAVLSFLALLVLSLAVLLLWIGLIVAGVVLARSWWSMLWEQQNFAREVEEAESLAEHMMKQQKQQQRPTQPVRMSSPLVQVPPAPVSLLPAAALAGSSIAYMHYRDTLPIAPAVGGRGRRLATQPLDPQQAAASVGLLSTAPTQSPVVEKTEEPIEGEMVSKETIEKCDTIPTLPEKVVEQNEREAEPREPYEQQTLRLAVGVASDPGVVRRNYPNEDSLLALQGTHLTNTGLLPLGLFVVADGMGGHAHGREASRTAIRTISDIVAPVLLRPNAEEELYAELLKDGVQRANFAIYQRNRQQSHMMGTTITAALVFGETVHVVNVGDSRTYLYRPGKGLSQVTRDHSIVARLVEKGIIAPDDVYSHPKRNQIYRCLGEHSTVELDTFKVTVQPDDVLLLCSDGLWEMVHDSTIEKIVHSSTSHASQISSMLMQAALNNGGADNVSIVVVCVTGE
jgi:serine/threonine protein phosphatase PrpC